MGPRLFQNFDNGAYEAMVVVKLDDFLQHINHQLAYGEIPLFKTCMPEKNDLVDC